MAIVSKLNNLTITNLDKTKEKNLLKKQKKTNSQMIKIMKALIINYLKFHSQKLLLK